MDYVVGSIAALISGDPGNVTPNRPKLTKRAITPTKHQSSPNVTPKSGFLDDRSIFLSPSLQKKKAIIKKSPKRIFQTPDILTDDQDKKSPKADKVKKHLKDDLDGNIVKSSASGSPKSPKINASSPRKLLSNDNEISQDSDSKSSKKKKRKLSLVSEEKTSDKENSQAEECPKIEEPLISPKKNKSQISSDFITDSQSDNSEIISVKKKKKHRSSATELLESNSLEHTILMPESENKLKKNKKKKLVQETVDNLPDDTIEHNSISNIPDVTSQKKKKQKKKQIENQSDPQDESLIKKTKKNKKNKINLNAITDKDTDSEHDSDDEIVSETEQANNEAFNADLDHESSDDEEETNTKKTDTKGTEKKLTEVSQDEVKKTIFVGNVPFSKKCKKEIKKIFSKHGEIDSVRIRTVPVKDARYTPKLAVIKNELHPDRSTVNVYVKFKDEASVEQALIENNTILNNNHLRVSRIDHSEHDQRLAVFVGNLPFAIEDEQFRAKFESCGDILSVRVVRDRKTNAGKGFGYVNFASKDGVELALAMTDEDLTIKNRILRVKRCTTGNNQAGKRDKPTGNNRPSNQGKFQNNTGRNNSIHGRFQNNTGRSNTMQGRFQNSGPGKMNRGSFGQGSGGDGAYRRIMNKRPHQESTDGPPNKKQNIQQPSKEKKTKKEFVGVTSEKKKKRKFDKGQKKKKAISEILTKQKKE